MKNQKCCTNENCSASQANKKFTNEYLYCPFCKEDLSLVETKEPKVTDEQIKEQLSPREKEAEETIQDPEKFERLLQRLSKKLKHVPVVGTALSDIPMLVSLVNAYVHKEYTDAPLGSIIAITGALIYVVSPLDLIPDAIPAIGLTDDALVIAWVVKMVHDDIEEYKQWMKENGKVLVEDY